ncbi:MAG: hypothetical protein ACXAB4_05585 [Candidatus Hodarchaeales archaeon]
MGKRSWCGPGFFGPWVWHSSSTSVEEQIAFLNYKKKKLERILGEIDQEIEDLKGTKD